MIDFGVGCKIEENNNLHKSGLDFVDPSSPSFNLLAGVARHQEARSKDAAFHRQSLDCQYLYTSTYHCGTLHAIWNAYNPSN